MIPGINLPFLRFEFDQTVGYNRSLILVYKFDPSDSAHNPLLNNHGATWWFTGEGEVAFRTSPSLDIIKELRKIEDAPAEYLKYIDEILDIHENSDDYLESDGVLQTVQGSGSAELPSSKGMGLVHRMDRHIRQGAVSVDYDFSPTCLSEEWSMRHSVAVGCSPNCHSIEAVIDSIVELDRTPVLVVLNRSDAANKLDVMSEHFSKYIPLNQQSVLSRTPSEEPKFNNLVYSRGLNNWVDDRTQVVYIFGNSLPKVLFTPGWVPMTAVVENSLTTNGRVTKFIENRCDLIIYREYAESLYRKHSKNFRHI